MIGVVVWSSRRREQAVIWCDDHAALAYLVGRDDFPVEHNWPEPGDMVELNDEVQGELRCARSVRPLGDSPVSHLPRILDHHAGGRRAHLAVVGEADATPAQAAPLQVGLRRVAC